MLLLRSHDWAWPALPVYAIGGFANKHMSNFSFCESVHATGRSLWHIRRLTEVGRKLGGGADTPALCGRVVAWDINVDITQFHLNKNTCKACSDALFKEINP